MQLYQLLFPNGKSYIGITSKTAQERFKKHCRPSTKKNPCQHAIHKYGADNVAIIVIATFDNWELLCLAEVEAIEKLNTIAPNGYNLTLGGEGRLTVGLCGEERIARDKARAAANSKIYVAANKAEIAEKQKIYRDTNKVELAIYRKKYRKANKVEISAKAKARRKANKVKVNRTAAQKAYQKAYYEANKAEVSAREKNYLAMNKKAILRKHKGVGLALVIFSSNQGISRALGHRVTRQAVHKWRNNSVPAKHRATLVTEAKKRGFDIEDFDLRGDL